jgi:3-oxoacyl-[acyl-carrier-protein] synthase II
LKVKEGKYLRRVVITGLGVVSPIGNDIEAFTANLKAGKHGFSLGKWFSEHSDEDYVSARVKDFDAGEYFEKKELRRTDVLSQYAVYAAMKALADCGCDFKSGYDPYRCGCYIATGIGGIETAREQIINYHEKGAKRVSVFTIPMMIGNMAPGLVAIKTGSFKGNNYCPVSACASSAHSLGEAFRAIKHGYLDVAIAGGVECCHLGFAYAAFNNMTALTSSKNPDRASIPFDKERSGFVLGDGGGVLILEEYEQAVKRGAKIYGEIAGYGATCDAFHETSPNPDGSGGAKAMMLAYEEAGLKPEEVDYVNAHGTSTPINDPTETLAIKTAFGNHAAKLRVNSTKSMTGHLLGAAGAVEAIAVLKQIQEGFVHKTAGYEQPDPDCDLDYVVEGLRDSKINAAVSNSLGFGGHNVSLCFRRV